MVDLKGILAVCGVILGIVRGFQWGSSRSWLLGLVAALAGIFIGGMAGFTVGMLLELFEEFVSRTSDKLRSKNRILAFLFRAVCALLVLTVVCGGLYWGVRTFARNQRSKATSAYRTDPLIHQSIHPIIRPCPPSTLMEAFALRASDRGNSRSSVLLVLLRNSPNLRRRRTPCSCQSGNPPPMLHVKSPA